MVNYETIQQSYKLDKGLSYLELSRNNHIFALSDVKIRNIPGISKLSYFVAANTVKLTAAFRALPFRTEYDAIYCSGYAIYIGTHTYHSYLLVTFRSASANMALTVISGTGITYDHSQDNTITGIISKLLICVKIISNLSQYQFTKELQLKGSIHYLLKSAFRSKHIALFAINY